MPTGQEVVERGSVAGSKLALRVQCHDHVTVSQAASPGAVPRSSLEHGLHTDTARLLPARQHSGLPVFFPSTSCSPTALAYMERGDTTHDSENKYRTRPSPASVFVLATPMICDEDYQITGHGGMESTCLSPSPQQTANGNGYLLRP